jgi:hypothetical protein
MKLIYANIIWFTLLIFGILNASIGRFNSEEWISMSDVRLKYTLLYGGVILFLIISIIGLLLKKSWGYKIALTSNLIMTLIPLSMFFVSFFILSEIPISEIFSIHAFNLTVGIVSLIFWLAQLRLGVKAENKL